MKITVIPQSKKMFSSESLKSNSKRKVAAYARVSTDSDEQLNSYEAQIEYYRSFITAHEDWEFVGIYTEMLTPTLIQMHPTCTQFAP